MGLLMYYNDKKKHTVLTHVFARVFVDVERLLFTVKTTNGCRKN